MFAFFAPVFYGNSGFIFMQAFFWLDTVTIFFCKHPFTFLTAFGLLMQAVSGFFLVPKPCRLQLTLGFAQYGRTEAVFQLLFFNLAFVPAGQTSLNFCS